MKSRAYQTTPTPVLVLLPSLLTAKTNRPQVLAATAPRWLTDAIAQREWVVRHALRFAIKRGEASALEVLGYGKRANVAIRNAAIRPQCASLGDAVTISFDLHNTRKRKQNVLVDLQVHFVKARGAPRPKVFKLKSFELAANQTVQLKKKLSLVELTTRRHYPGRHLMEALVNGRPVSVGTFDLLGDAAVRG